MNGLDPPSEFGVYSSLPSAIVDRPAPGSWLIDALRLKAPLALGRRAETWEVGRGGGRCGEIWEAARFGVDAVLIGELPKEGRGRPRERRWGVEVAISN